MQVITKPQNLQASEPITSFLGQIQTYIINQVMLGRKFTIKDVSEELNLSEYNMNKIIIKGTGQTLKSFIANCRRDRYVNDAANAGNRISQKAGICLPCRKTGVNLLQLSAKRIRLQ